MTRIAKGAGNVVHTVRADDAGKTDCGRKISHYGPNNVDGWFTVLPDNEYLYGGPCMACLNYTSRRPATTDAERWIREGKGAATPAMREAMVRPTVKRETPTAAFTPGQRVGILTGFQSRGGAWITGYGTVVRSQEFWTGTLDYIVRADSDGQELVYSAWMLSADVSGDRVSAMKRHPAGKGRTNGLTLTVPIPSADLYTIGETFRRRGFTVRRADKTVTAEWLVMAYRDLPGIERREYVVARIMPGATEWHAGTYTRDAAAADGVYRRRLSCLL